MFGIGWLTESSITTLDQMLTTTYPLSVRPIDGIKTLHTLKIDQRTPGRIISIPESINKN
jgi:hypothetical protein